MHEFVKCALARKVVKVFVSCVELQKNVQKYNVVILSPSSHLARVLACTARPRTRGASRRRQPLGVAMAGRLKARLVDRGALATRLVAF